MIALDTNILIRYLLAGQDKETGRARRLIETDLSGDQQGHVTAITLCEIIWVLRNRYKFGIDAQIAVVRLMLDSAQLDIEHDDCAHAALECGHADLARRMFMVSWLALFIRGYVWISTGSGYVSKEP